MRNVRLAALAVIVAGGALLARPVESTVPPPDDGGPTYCCCVMTLLGCADYCCGKNGCSISAGGCVVKPD